MTAYCKLHVDIVGDRALVPAHRDGEQGTPLLPWFLNFSKLDNDYGRRHANGPRLTVKDFHLRAPWFSLGEIEASLAAFVSLGVLHGGEDGVVKFVRWERHGLYVPFHTNAFGSPKLMQAHQGGARGIGLLPWLILQAKRIDDNGKLSAGQGIAANATTLAGGIPATAGDVEDSIDSFLAVGTLRRALDGVLVFANWKHWQPPGWKPRRRAKPSDDPDATRERKRRQRERERATIDGAVPEA
jgi:hypothetical protein